MRLELLVFIFLAQVSLLDQGIKKVLLVLVSPIRLQRQLPPRDNIRIGESPFYIKVFYRLNCCSHGTDHDS